MKVPLHNSFVVSKLFLILGLLTIWTPLGTGIPVALASLAYISQKSRMLNLQTRLRFNTAVEHGLLISALLFFTTPFFRYPFLQTLRGLMIGVFVLTIYYVPYFLVKYRFTAELKLNAGAD